MTAGDREAVLITAPENLDVRAAELLRDQLNALQAGPRWSQPDLTVDLGAVEFISAAALSVLAAGQARARAGGFVITSPKPAAARIIAASGLAGVLAIREPAVMLFKVSVVAWDEDGQVSEITATVDREAAAIIAWLLRQRPARLTETQSSWEITMGTPTIIALLDAAPAAPAGDPRSARAAMILREIKAACGIHGDSAGARP